MPCNYLIVNYGQDWTNGVLHIQVQTDVLTRLTLQWTDNETWMHLQEEDKRGLTLLKDPYFCFVEWNSIPQLQPGDTLLHDFLFPGWAVGDCFWWHFTGTLADVPCTSATQIFSECFEYAGQDPPFPPDPERIELMAFPTITVQSPIPIQLSTSGKLVTSFTMVIS